MNFELTLWKGSTFFLAQFQAIFCTQLIEIYYIINTAVIFSHHLWYLQVSALLTRSVIEDASPTSSKTMTNGTSSVPQSRSIWLARLDKYNWRSWGREHQCEALQLYAMQHIWYVMF